MAGKTSIVDNNGIEREVAKVSITVDKTERKVSKIMQTVNGVWQNVYSSGIILHYTGTTNKGTDRDYEFDDGTIALKFLTGGTLSVLDGEATIEACLVGGGFSGGRGAEETTPDGYGGYIRWWYGGRGGKSGYLYNTPKIKLKKGDSFYISVGGAGSNTTGFGYSSSSGSQRTGSSENGLYAFNDSSFDGIRYAPSGGYGSSWHSQNSGGMVQDGAATPGGNTGGGYGATNTTIGNNATGYGAGGGGGSGNNDGGYGYKGIAIMRSAKEAA